MPSRVDYYPAADNEYATQPSRKNSAGFPLQVQGYVTPSPATTSKAKPGLLDKFVEAHDELQAYRSVALTHLRGHEPDLT